MIFDPMYILFLAPGMLFMLWAQRRVHGQFSRYRQVHNLAGLTGAQAARRILDLHGLSDVTIERVPGHLTDHYDPRTRVIRLSPEVHDMASIAAVGVAAHEAGHAIQHAQAYAPLKVRTAIVPVVNVGSSLGFFVLLLGLMIGSLPLGWLGVALFALATVFALLTLPVEFDATRRAKLALAQAGIVPAGAASEDAAGVERVLGAAAWTYIAGFATSLLTLLYYVQLMLGLRASEE
ncbi:MAG: zinc metallopeptidase [Chloroflexota bacterium]